MPLRHVDWHAKQETVRVETEYHEFDVAYRDVGDGDRPTLFLHGIPTWSFLFRDVYDVADRALLPDLAGYGYTRHVGEGGFDRSMPTQEELILGFLEALGLESVQVVAHDIGGGVALRLACHTDVVGRLVLSNATCYDSFPIEFVHSLGVPAKAREWNREDVAEILDSIFRRMWTEERATEEFLAGMKAPFLETDRDLMALSRNAVAANTNHTLEITHLHKTIDAPTLLLWGAENEGQHTSYADMLAEEIPTVEKEYIDEARHWVMQDCPEMYREGLAPFLE